MTELPRSFYERPVVEVARDLLGCIVEHEGAAGVIVETEAYHDSEPACHAFVGLTPRTSTLFGAPGRAYVYRSYGIHAMLNAVCEPEGTGAAVLIRALQPLAGMELMKSRRVSAPHGPDGNTGNGAFPEIGLCSGPGKLTQALGIELAHNGVDLAEGPVVIRGAPAGSRAAAPLSGPRVGISKGVELRWRFCVAGNPHVSRPLPR
jgi:DNA-3-methyladenine glycosylase